MSKSGGVDYKAEFRCEFCGRYRRCYNRYRLQFFGRADHLKIPICVGCYKREFLLLNTDPDNHKLLQKHRQFKEELTAAQSAVKKLLRSFNDLESLRSDIVRPQRRDIKYDPEQYLKEIKPKREFRTG